MNYKIKYLKYKDKYINLKFEKERRILINIIDDYILVKKYNNHIYFIDKMMIHLENELKYNYPNNIKINIVINEIKNLIINNDSIDIIMHKFLLLKCY
jgi:hypothetical protein